MFGSSHINDFNNLWNPQPTRNGIVQRSLTQGVLMFGLLSINRSVCLTSRSQEVALGDRIWLFWQPWRFFQSLTTAKVLAFCHLFAFVIARPVTIVKLLSITASISKLVNWRLLSARLLVFRRVPTIKTRSFNIHVIGSCSDKLEC